MAREELLWWLWKYSGSAPALSGSGGTNWALLSGERPQTQFSLSPFTWMDGWMCQYQTGRIAHLCQGLCCPPWGGFLEGFPQLMALWNSTGSRRHYEHRRDIPSPPSGSKSWNFPAGIGEGGIDHQEIGPDVKTATQRSVQPPGWGLGREKSPQRILLGNSLCFPNFQIFQKPVLGSAWCWSSSGSRTRSAQEAAGNLLVKYVTCPQRV